MNNDDAEFLTWANVHFKNNLDWFRRNQSPIRAAYDRGVRDMKCPPPDEPRPCDLNRYSELEE